MSELAFTYRESVCARPGFASIGVAMGAPVVIASMGAEKGVFRKQIHAQEIHCKPEFGNPKDWHPSFLG